MVFHSIPSSLRVLSFPSSPIWILPHFILTNWSLGGPSVKRAHQRPPGCTHRPTQTHMNIHTHRPNRNSSKASQLEKPAWGASLTQNSAPQPSCLPAHFASPSLWLPLSPSSCEGWSYQWEAGTGKPYNGVYTTRGYYDQGMNEVSGIKHETQILRLGIILFWLEQVSLSKSHLGLCEIVRLID